jgi:hypothetical protein
MINPTRVGRHLVTLFFGLAVAGVAAFIVAAWSRVAAVIVFILLTGFWIMSLISFVRRQVEARGGRLGMIADPQHWTPEALPVEFRFITRDTPMHEVLDKIGAPSKRPPIPRGAVRYDWPDGRIIFVYASSLSSRCGSVNAIQIYDEPSDIPIDEII